jgi:hypothetical protein
MIVPEFFACPMPRDSISENGFRSVPDSRPNGNASDFIDLPFGFAERSYTTCRKKTDRRNVGTD